MHERSGYRFTKTVKIEGTTYTDGTIIRQGEIPEGHFQSLLRQGILERYVPDEHA